MNIMRVSKMLVNGNIIFLLFIRLDLNLLYGDIVLEQLGTTG